MGALSDANINEASVILGFSAPTIRKFISQGMPVKSKGGRGKDYTLDLPACVNWIAEQRVNNAVGDVSLADLEELKKRKLAAETTIAEIEAAKLRSEVVYVQDAIRAFTHEALAVKARILAIPQRLAAALAGINDQRQIKQILTDELHATLEELSARSVDVPAVLGAGDEQGGAGVVETTAKPKAQPVGRKQRPNPGRKRKAG